MRPLSRRGQQICPRSLWVKSDRMIAFEGLSFANSSPDSSALLVKTRCFLSIDVVFLSRSNQPHALT